MMKRYTVIALFFATLTIPVLAAEPYQVVVNAKNPIASISKGNLRDYFLGKATRWPDGSAVRPIDLPEVSNTRASFSKVALGRDTVAVKSYWLTMLFSGRGTPPVQFENDDRVLSNVRTSPGAIGYVSSSTSVGDGAKAIPVTE